MKYCDLIFTSGCGITFYPHFFFEENAFRRTLMMFHFTGRPIIGWLRRPDRTHAQADPQGDSRRQAPADDRLLGHASLIRRQENGGKLLIVSGTFNEFLSKNSFKIIGSFEKF